VKNLRPTAVRTPVRRAKLGDRASLLGRGAETQWYCASDEGWEEVEDGLEEDYHTEVGYSHFSV